MKEEHSGLYQQGQRLISSQKAGKETINPNARECVELAQKLHCLSLMVELTFIEPSGSFVCGSFCYPMPNSNYMFCECV